MRFLPVMLLGVATVCAGERIAEIEFFGHKGLDTAKVRASLPVKEGDPYSEQTEGLVRRAVAAALGKEATDVWAPCCFEHGDRLLFIGLPGATFKNFAYRSAPTGDDRLSPVMMDLCRRFEEAARAAVHKGGGAVSEDDSRGYGLIQDPAARSIQMATRRWALQHEPELIRVLEFSSSVEHRRAAGHALGYARQGRRQITALVRAAGDPDDEVRNNVTRALGVLVRSNAKLAAEIPPDAFIEMLSSGMWTDRNKGTMLVEQLTAGRDPALLARIRASSMDALVEMALWRQTGYSAVARLVLGRVAGLPEDRLQELAWKGPVEAILEAVHHH